MPRSRLAPGVLATLIVVACGTPGASRDPIFIDGRAVAAAGDTLLALTRQGSSAITVRDRRTGAVYTRGSAALKSPQHIEERAGKWYVSDAADGGWWIVVFTARWDVARRLRVNQLASAPHQFAVLPDGRIVLEAPDARLIVLDDSVDTFALTQQSGRTGLLVGALGGVLHAIPDRSVTLYNANGKIRWRLPWPWREEAYVADLAVDALGRIHVLAGEEGRNRFVAFSLSPTTGEVVRWSEPGPAATFVVSRMGEIEPDSASRWIGGD